MQTYFQNYRTVTTIDFLNFTFRGPCILGIFRGPCILGIFRGPCILGIFQHISNKMQHYTVCLYLVPAPHVKAVSPPIIRSTHKSIYSIWYLSKLYCYLPLWYMSYSLRAVSGRSVLILLASRQQTCMTYTIAAGRSNGLTSARCCRYSCVCSLWWVEIPPETCGAVYRYK